MKTIYVLCLMIAAGAGYVLGAESVLNKNKALSEEKTMQEREEHRLNYREASPAAFNAMLALSKYATDAGLEPGLVNLVFMRASQINGCAFCLNMHTKDLKAAGEDTQRLILLPVWKEAAGVYTERERAALGWTEAITLIAETHVPEEVYASAKKQFTEKELTDLTIAIIAINGWNRLNIAFKTPVVCDIQ